MASYKELDYLTGRYTDKFTERVFDMRKVYKDYDAKKGFKHVHINKFIDCCEDSYVEADDLLKYGNGGEKVVKTMVSCDAQSKHRSKECERKEKEKERAKEKNKKKWVSSMATACKKAAYPMPDLQKLREESKRREAIKKECIKEQAATLIENGDMLALSGLDFLTPQEEHLAENCLSKDLEDFKADVKNVQNMLKTMTKMVDTIANQLDGFEKTFNSLNNMRKLN